MLVVEWEGQRRVVADLDELDDLLDHIHASTVAAPVLVSVIRADGESLTIGLGRELSVLSHVPADMNPPYRASAGDVEGDELVSYSFQGSYSEFPMTDCVPLADARFALREFAANGTLSARIRWHEV